jgi:hypothetical protein
MLCLPGGNPRTPGRGVGLTGAGGLGQPSALPGSSTLAPSCTSFSMKFS